MIDCLLKLGRPIPTGTQALIKDLERLKDLEEQVKDPEGYVKNLKRQVEESKGENSANKAKIQEAKEESSAFKAKIEVFSG